MNIVIIICQIAILVATIILLKFDGKDSAINNTMKNLEIIEYYAKAFINWADEFRSNCSGNDKMKVVINQLIDICNEYNIVQTTEELKAIVQKVYNEYKSKNKLPEVIPVITETTNDKDESVMLLDDDIKLVK